MDFFGADENVELYERARELVLNGAYDEAREIAERLERQNYSGAYEIGAMARAGQGELAQAAAYLKEGTEVAPKVWINWQLLGNYLSDLERFEEAADAYVQARACPGADVDSIALNQAILAGRCGQDAEAAAFLKDVTHPDFALPVEDVRIGLLLDTGKHAEAAAHCERVLQELDSVEAPDVLAAGRIAGHLARARSASGANAQAVEAAVLQGLSYDPMSEYLHWALREADLRTSPEARMFRLVLACQAEDDASPRYRVTYFVVAENADAAVALALRVEQAAGGALDSVAATEEREPAPAMPIGVYSRSGPSWIDPST